MHIDVDPTGAEDAPRPDRPKTFFTRVEGYGGGITVPHIGIHVGTITRWNATRHGDEGRDAALFDLHASLSFVNRAIWEDAEYEKEVVVRRRNGNEFHVRQAEGYRTHINDRMLTMEGVELCHPEP